MRRRPQRRRHLNTVCRGCTTRVHTPSLSSAFLHMQLPQGSAELGVNCRSASPHTTSPDTTPRSKASTRLRVQVLQGSTEVGREQVMARGRPLAPLDERRPRQFQRAPAARAPRPWSLVVVRTVDHRCVSGASVLLSLQIAKLAANYRTDCRICTRVCSGRHHQNVRVHHRARYGPGGTTHLPAASRLCPRPVLSQAGDLGLACQQNVLQHNAIRQCHARPSTQHTLGYRSVVHAMASGLNKPSMANLAGADRQVMSRARRPHCSSANQTPDAGAQASLQSRASMVSRESTVDTTNPLAWRTAAASSRRRGPGRTAARGRRSTRPARTAAAGSRRATGRRPTAPARPTARQACRACGAAAASPTAPRAGPSAPWQTCTSDQAQLSSVAVRCEHGLACALVPCRNVTSQGAGRRPQRCVRPAPPMPVPAANVQVGAR